MEAEENARKWRLSRRRFLQITAAASASSAIGAAAPNLGWGSGSSDETVAAESTPSEKDSRIRKWMMIIDLRRCDGCQSVDLPPQCTQGCIAGHSTPAPMEWMEVYEHEKDTDAARERIPEKVTRRDGRGTFFLPTNCMQCQNPPCVNVCPVGATWTTPEGVTLIDQQRCIGCRLCIGACPYERRFFTWGDPPVPPESLFVEYSPLHQQPYMKGVVYKCDFCMDLTRAGRLPYCAASCPQNAIYYGDLEEDLATNGEEVVSVSEFLSDHSAYRYKEELGTRPRVYYVAGHGELAGRDPKTRGRKAIEWPFKEVVEGAKTWERSQE